MNLQSIIMTMDPAMTMALIHHWTQTVMERRQTTI